MLKRLIEKNYYDYEHYFLVRGWAVATKKEAEILKQKYLAVQVEPTINGMFIVRRIK